MRWAANPFNRVRFSVPALKFIIIIRGPAGVGKTTVAKKLASKLKADYFSFDKIMEENKLDAIVGDGIPSQNFVRANEIVISLIKQKNKVILDGCFYRKKQINHLLNNLKIKSYIFTLNADINECLKRNKTRKNPMAEEDIKQVHNLVYNLEIGTRIDTTNKSVQQIVSEILDQKLFKK